MGAEETAQQNIPCHVAIIMDGNGRWAQRRLLPRTEGHRAGAKSLENVIEVAATVGVRYLTVFAFSTENWKRPESEVSALMKMLEYHLHNTSKKLIKNDIRLRVIGERERLSEGVQKAIKEVEEASRNCQRMDFIMALSYGGRREIVEATRKIAEKVQAGDLAPSEISEATLTNNMYLPDVPDPDLLIRTSGECRISNFLLWQLAYAEIVVKDVFWPDFGKEEFLDCLKQYAKRDRRYGLTQEQISK